MSHRFRIFLVTSLLTVGIPTACYLAWHRFTVPWKEAVQFVDTMTNKDFLIVDEIGSYAYTFYSKDHHLQTMRSIPDNPDGLGKSAIVLMKEGQTLTNFTNSIGDIKLEPVTTVTLEPCRIFIFDQSNSSKSLLEAFPNLTN